MNDLRKKILDTQYKSIKLRSLAIDNRISPMKTIEIRKEQDKLYKKWIFLKNLESAIRKG